jgi:hypothetical protein
MESLPQQDMLTACLDTAMQPFPTPSSAAVQARWRTLHPDVTAPVSWSEMNLAHLLLHEWHEYTAGSVCLEVLLAHTLPFFAQPATVDFGLLREPRTLHICPNDSSSSTEPMHPPPFLVAFMRGWLRGLRRAGLGFAQRADGVIVRRALIVGVQTVFNLSEEEKASAAAAEEEEVVVGSKRKQQPVEPELLLWNNGLGHQLLLLCELPPAFSAEETAANTAERPFTRIKLTIVDNLSSRDYRWPVHKWIAHAFAQAQLAVWPVETEEEAEGAGACRCEIVCNALYTNARLSTSCMATSFRAVLIASLLRDPATKLRQRESLAEGRRFSTLIALHLYRMRRFLLTDERIWSPTQPHAVFVDGSPNGKINAANFKEEDEHEIGSPLVSPCMVWAVPLRHVPHGMGSADIARWVFERSRLPVHPLFFEPSLSRPLGLSYRPPAREGTPTCITSSRLSITV